MKTFILNALTLVSFLFIGGCGSLLDFGGDKVPDNIYDLSITKTESIASGETGKTLLMERLTFPAFIDTEKIAVKPSDNEIVYLANARWSDKGPNLVARYLLITLDGTNGWLVIDRQHTALVHDFRLEVDIRDFSLHLNGEVNPTVVIEISADLIAVNPLRVLSRQSFSQEVRANANSKDAIIQAFNEALSGITDEVSGWLQQTVN